MVWPGRRSTGCRTSDLVSGVSRRDSPQRLLILHVRLSGVPSAWRSPTWTCCDLLGGFDGLLPADVLHGWRLTWLLWACTAEIYVVCVVTWAT